MNDFACASTAFARVDVSAAFIDQWIARVDPPSLDGECSNDAADGQRDDATPLLDAAGVGDGDVAAADSAVTADADSIDADSINSVGARRSGCSVAHGTGRPGSFVAMMMMLGVALVGRRHGLLR